MSKKAAFDIGDLIARVEAPTVIHRIASRHPVGFLHALPYRRSGREVYLDAVGRGAGRVLIGDGSQWVVVGHD